VNLLQGTIDAKNVQLGYYFKIADLKALSQQILAATETIGSALANTMLTC
jgi:hypothetical protein